MPISEQVFTQRHLCMLPLFDACHLLCSCSACYTSYGTFLDSSWIKPATMTALCALVVATVGLQTGR